MLSEHLEMPHIRRGTRLTFAAAAASVIIKLAIAGDFPLEKPHWSGVVIEDIPRSIPHDKHTDSSILHKIAEMVIPL